MDANLFAFGAVDTVQTGAAVVLALAWYALAACFALLVVYS